MSGNTTRARSRRTDETLRRKHALPKSLRLLVTLVCHPTRLVGSVLIICLLFGLSPDAPKVLAEATAKQVNGQLIRQVSRWSERMQQDHFFKYHKEKEDESFKALVLFVTPLGSKPN